MLRPTAGTALVQRPVKWSSSADSAILGAKHRGQDTGMDRTLLRRPPLRTGLATFLLLWLKQVLLARGHRQGSNSRRTRTDDLCARTKTIPRTDPQRIVGARREPATVSGRRLLAVIGQRPLSHRLCGLSGPVARSQADRDHSAGAHPSGQR